MTHHHAIQPPEGPPRPRLAWALAAVVAAIALLSLVALGVLWPDRADVPQGADPYGNVAILDATVEKATPFDCNSSGIGPDNTPMVEGSCAQVTAETERGTSAVFTLDPTRYVGAGMEKGDQIRVIEISPEGQQATYEFYDHQLEGLKVVTTAGHDVGTVAEVLHTAAGELLAVRDADNAEVLVPFVSAIVVSVSLQDQLVTIDPPEGLLELG